MICDILHYLQQLLGSLFDKLHNWQQLLGSFLGLIAILLGALFNARLNRMRDDRLRAEEANSVLAALYGEILLLRNEICDIASIISFYAKDKKDEAYQNAQFVNLHSLSEPVLYKQLASKFGIIEPDMIISITEFYKNYEEARHRLSLIAEPLKIKNKYVGHARSFVLVPCIKAVENIEITLRQIESRLSLKPSSNFDLGDAYLVIEEEENL